MHKFSTLHARFIIASAILQKVEESGKAVSDYVEQDAIRAALAVKINDFWLEAIDIDALTSVHEAIQVVKNHYEHLICYTDVRVAIDEAVNRLIERTSS